MTSGFWIRRVWSPASCSTFYCLAQRGQHTTFAVRDSTFTFGAASPAAASASTVQQAHRRQFNKPRRRLSNGRCRNNAGNWPLHAVEYHGRDHGLEFYTAKDDAMLRDADFGLFGWDGKSKGRLRNVRIMAERGKPSAVYVSPIKRFVTVRHPQDVSSLSPEMDARAVPAEDLFSETQAPGSAIADPNTIGVA